MSHLMNDIKNILLTIKYKPGRIKSKGVVMIKNFLLSLCLLCGVLYVPQFGFSEDTPIDPHQLFDKGISYYQKGHFENAAHAFEQTFHLVDPLAHQNLYIATTLYLADAYQSMGYHQRAIDLLTKTMPVVESSKNMVSVVQFYSRLGDLYFSLGNMGKVVDYMVKGVEEARKIDNPRLLASILNNVGNALAVEKDYKSAEALFGEALELVTDSEENADLKSKILLNYLRLEFQKGRYKQIIMALETVLAHISGLPDSHQKASDLMTLGLLVNKIREQTVKDDRFLINASYLAFDDAKRIATSLKDVRLISYASGYIAQLYEEQGNFDDALKLTRSAVFFAEQGNYPEILYLWQWQIGRLFKAKGDLSNAMIAYENAIKTLNPIRQELFLGYRTKKDFFNQNVKPVYLGKAELLLLEAEQMNTKEDREAKLIAARDTMEMLKTAELEDFFKDECVTARPMDDSNKLVRTPENTAIIYPITLPNYLAILVTLPDGIQCINENVSMDELKEKVIHYRKQLQTRPNNRFLYDSQQLYNWVIRPIENILVSHDIRTLVVAPDGALRLIPFSTLHDGKQFLIENYAISTIPAISLTDPQPVDKEKFKLLLVGLAEGRQGFSPLPSVPAELRDIKKIMNAQVMIQDDQYTIDNITNEFKRDEYSLLHIATHGVFGGTPEESFLLTYESKLNMNLLENLIGLSKFRKQKVELLTLSACQTALGNERAAMGLAGVAVKAGVKGAIATLWFVDDEATSLAIREFYRQLQKPELSKAQAMQNVQKKLINQRRYWHPLYWAPFLVIGNWM